LVIHLQIQKFLFFVSCKNRPLCIIKIARSIEFNNIIERELEGMRHFSSIGLHVPKLFFSGQVRELKCVCQENNLRLSGWKKQ